MLCILYTLHTQRGHDEARQAAGQVAHLPVPQQGTAGRHRDPEQADQLLHTEVRQYYNTDRIMKYFDYIIIKY